MLTAESYFRPDCEVSEEDLHARFWRMDARFLGEAVAVGETCGAAFANGAEGRTG